MDMDCIELIRCTDEPHWSYQVGKGGVVSIVRGKKGWYPDCFVVLNEFDETKAVCSCSFWFDATDRRVL